MGGAEQGGYSGGEGGGGAGSDGVDVGCVTQVEASVAMGGVCWRAVGGGGVARAAGATDPSADGEVGP